MQKFLLQNCCGITGHSMIEFEEEKQLYPAFLKLRNLSILIIGNGNTGLAKLHSLLPDASNASITLLATLEKEGKNELSTQNAFDTIHQPLLEALHPGAIDILILASDDAELFEQVNTIANSQGLIVTENDNIWLSPFYIDKTNYKSNMPIGFAKGEETHVRNRFIKNTQNLDATTKVLMNDGETNNRWRKVATYSLLAFGFMFIGYFIAIYLPLQQVLDGTYEWYLTSGKEFSIILLAGFLAQLVDGALGMGYGVTSATILLSAGISPAAMSGSIHTAEMFASGASGYSHYKFGNVNIKLFKALVIPGVLGAIMGAVLLVWIGDQYGNFIKPIIAAYTLFLGIKFIITAFRGVKKQKKFKRYRLLAACGGFFDSFGGGGWGPIVTSTLINNGRNHKYVIGSVSLTEFFVTLSSAFAFFTMIGVSHWQTILALIIGGFVAAPLAAKLAGRLPRKISFILLGTLVIIWSIRILIKLI